jgi:Uma2 family endonuclease
MVMATAAKTGPKLFRPRPGARDLKAVEIPPEAHTHDGFIDWIASGAVCEKLRATFYAGRVSVDMSEENIDTHTNVKSGVYRTLLPLVAAGDWGSFYADGVLLSNKTAEVATNPDGVAVSWASFESGRVTFGMREGSRRFLVGSPDWVLEIVSDSSVTKDLHALRGAYHRARIPEYWLIDARREEPGFQILTWRRGGSVAAARKDGWAHSRVFHCDFRLTRAKDRLGAWSYSLDVRREESKARSRS